MFTYTPEANGVNRGLVGSDTFTGALARASGESVGTYAITQGTLANGNYAITYVSDNYSITQRPITITASPNQTKVYGSNDASFTYSVEANSVNRGLVGSDTFSGSLTRVAGETVGAYAINQGTLANGNYAITYVSDNYAITQKALTVTANQQQSTYGSSINLGATDFTVVGLVPNTGDSVQSASLLFNGSNTVPATTNAGTYTGGVIVSAAAGSGLSNYARYLS